MFGVQAQNVPSELWIPSRSVTKDFVACAREELLEPDDVLALEHGLDDLRRWNLAGRRIHRDLALARADRPAGRGLRDIRSRRRLFDAHAGVALPIRDALRSNDVDALQDLDPAAGRDSPGKDALGTARQCWLDRGRPGR
jgi:hypothetical protein